MQEDHDTIVIGAGQAGLAMSAVLQRDDREHVVLEWWQVGGRWRWWWWSVVLERRVPAADCEHGQKCASGGLDGQTGESAARNAPRSLRGRTPSS